MTEDSGLKTHVVRHRKAQTTYTRVFLGIIWFLVWGAFSYSDPIHVFHSGFPESLFDLFNGIRAYVPFLALFISALLMMGRKPYKIFKVNKPLAFLTLYAVMGLSSSLLSPRGGFSAYWGALYLSVPLTGWLLTGYGKSLEKAEVLLQTNWIIAFLFVVYLSLGPLRPYILGKPLPAYIFPGIFRMSQNGVGRYAGVAALVALSRLRQEMELRRRIGWFLLFAISLNLLSLSQSRLALMGFAGGVAIILFSLRFHWIAFFTPVFVGIIYLSGFLWGSEGTLEKLFFLTGRPDTWSQGLEVISRSPLVGFGFRADRYFMGWQHMHNAFLHALIQSGILGTIFFIAAIYWIWHIVLKRNLIKKSLDISRIRNIYLSESLVILIFFTFRSFFESTAAFYGADLFFVVPAILFIQLYGEQRERRDRVRIPSIKEGER